MARNKQVHGDYDAFVDKFSRKLTTDDCYTPPAVYEQVLAWVKEKYAISDSTRIMRPFMPGGDYQSEDYSGDCVVIDNPPFSILSSIIDWYVVHAVKFVLFAPHLTLMTYLGRPTITSVVCSCNIVYENGATVPTSFVTNLTPEIAIETAPEIRRALIDVQHVGANRPPRYVYPHEVISISRMTTLVSYGQRFVVPRAEVSFTRGLDQQKKVGKAMYGSGLYCSRRLALEQRELEKQAHEQRALEQIDAHKWRLSDREEVIIDQLSS